MNPLNPLVVSFLRIFVRFPLKEGGDISIVKVFENQSQRRYWKRQHKRTFRRSPGIDYKCHSQKGTRHCIRRYYRTYGCSSKERQFQCGAYNDACCQVSHNEARYKTYHYGLCYKIPTPCVFNHYQGKRCNTQ